MAKARKLRQLPKFEIYPSNDEFRWRITSSSGDIFGASTEGYENYGDCLSNLKDLGEYITRWVEENPE